MLAARAGATVLHPCPEETAVRGVTPGRIAVRGAGMGSSKERRRTHRVPDPNPEPQPSPMPPQPGPQPQSPQSQLVQPLSSFMTFLLSPLETHEERKHYTACDKVIAPEGAARG